MKFTDQTGFDVEVNSTLRVISIVPSQTEFLVDIGLGERLIAVTKFCIHPEGLIREVGHVGGTKNLNLDKIRELNPDLIIGNKEENTKEQIEELRKDFPVWMSDIYSVDDALSMMIDLGKILNLEKESKSIVDSIQEKRSDYYKEAFQNKSCLYFIWTNPDMVVGSQNFIHDMIEESGMKNMGIELGERYPMLSEDIILSPDYIFLSTEPYPFKEEHIKEFQEKFPDSKVELVDGEMYSWYGSRMVKSYDYFEKLASEI